MEEFNDYDAGQFVSFTIVAIACVVLVSGLIPNWTGFSIHFGWVFNFFSLIFNSLLNITKRHFKRHGFA